MYNVHLTMKSRNSKTGPIPVSTTTDDTCPPLCAMRDACYAKGGPLAIHWRKVSEGLTGMAWSAFTAAIKALPDGTLWRHNQAGDLPGMGDKIDHKALAALVAANAGKRGFTYSHKPPTAANAKAVRAANAGGFTINLSGNSMAHADDLADLAIAPVVCVLPSDATANTTTPKGRKVVVCPATQRDNVSCSTCKLCAIADRGFIVGFPAHGAAHKRADRIVQAAS